MSVDAGDGYEEDEEEEEGLEEEELDEDLEEEDEEVGPEFIAPTGILKFILTTLIHVLAPRVHTHTCKHRKRQLTW